MITAEPIRFFGTRLHFDRPTCPLADFFVIAQRSYMPWQNTISGLSRYGKPETESAGPQLTQ